MSEPHSFAYDGQCRACGELYAGCRFCPATGFRKRGCSCAVEAIHTSRSRRWRLATEAPPAPAADK